MSKCRVLIVDDEPSLLTALERLLASEYDLVTASSGQEALSAMANHPPYPVVVTDMRMPKMDGIQLIQAARPKSPDTVFIMLTGNQDQTTAIRALNDGEVFRFLTKPCQSFDLRNAIDAACRQYQLVTSERELLQKTFVGAVSVLTDVLELAQPSIFGRGERVQEIVGTLQGRLRLESQWEYKLAARLGLLGFALLPEQERLRFEMGADLDDPPGSTIRAAALIGRRIIERIPRLGNVARIIGMMGDVDGDMLFSKLRSDEERIKTGATLLRVAIEWDFLLRQGLSPRGAAEELGASLPLLPPPVAAVLLEQDLSDSGIAGVRCSTSDLTEGMVLHDDILTADGTILIRKGRRLTWTIIEKLRSYETSANKLRIVCVKCAEVPQDEPALT